MALNLKITNFVSKNKVIDHLKVICLQDPYNLFSEAEAMNL